MMPIALITGAGIGIGLASARAFAKAGYRVILTDVLEKEGHHATAEITAVRGFGLWSAQMFLIFFLERPDVLPTGDLGIRKAAQAAYGLDQPPSPAELERIAEPWRPHRSLASVYLWESLSNEPV